MLTLTQAGRRGGGGGGGGVKRRSISTSDCLACWRFRDFACLSSPLSASPEPAKDSKRYHDVMRYGFHDAL